MRIVGGSLLLALCVPLAACGGGGGIASTPAPAPTPSPNPTPTPAPSPTPTPTNTAIGDLKASQAFQGTATTTDVVLGASDGFVGTTAVSSSPLTITYDAAAQTYTVETDGRSQSFGPADAQPQRWDGETRYAKSVSDGSEYLTLVSNPYSDPQYTNKYVAMGYWQHNIRAGTDQHTYFSTFTYGFDTPASGMPKSGSAHWITDIFGLLTIPNKELQIIQGLGDFDVDFAAGAWREHAFVDEANVVTQGGTSGALTLQAGGLLGTGSSFSGLLSYQGSSAYPILHGTLWGSFYGPNADEIGASFAASGGDAVLDGAMTGQRSGAGSTSDGIHNLTLTDIVAPERLSGDVVYNQWSVTEGQPGFSSVVNGSTTGSVDVGPGSPSTIGIVDGYTTNAADLDAAGPANFTTYRTTISGAPATISMYKIGSANTELPLTYTSFISWSTSELGAIPSGESMTTQFRRYMVYGIETPRDLMTARTGTASYAGVVYADGAAMNGTQYAIGGTSEFDVDFSAGSYAGWLQLAGQEAGGASRDFGKWSFAAALGYGQMAPAPLTGPGVNDPGSQIAPRFFGPSGQEIGATFNLRTGWPPDESSVDVVGATVAKQK